MIYRNPLICRLKNLGMDFKFPDLSSNCTSVEIPSIQLVNGTSSLLHSEIPVSKCNVLNKHVGI